ncbi:MAG: AgmX/PglI C-terminal domain-containing protein [Bdellovibrionales bacterium]
MTESIYLKMYWKNKLVVDLTAIPLPFSIGRDEACNCTVPEDSLDKVHIVIKKEGEVFNITDVSSQHNSIKVNGISVGSFTIVDAEVFEIPGDIKCEVGFFLSDNSSPNVELTGSVYDEKTSPGTNIDDATFINFQDQAQEIIKEQMEYTVAGDLAEILPEDGIAKYKNSPFLNNYIVHDSLKKRRKSLEANLFWNGKLISSRQLREGENLIVGPGEEASLQVPVVNRYRQYARLQKKGLRVNIPRGTQCKLLSPEQEWGQIPYDPGINKAMIYLEDNDQFVIRFDDHTFLYLRRIPVTKSLSDGSLNGAPSQNLEIITGSVIFHILILMFALFFAPEEREYPKLKDVPKRYAKLLTKPLPKPPEPPKPIIENPKPPESEKPKPKLEPKKIEPKKIEPKKEEPKKIVKKVEPKPKPKPKVKVKPKPKPKKVLPLKPARKPRKAKKVAVKTKKSFSKTPIKMESRSVKRPSATRAQKAASKEKNIKQMGALQSILGAGLPTAPTGTKNIQIAKVDPTKMIPQESVGILADELKLNNTGAGREGTVNRVKTTGSSGDEGYGTQGVSGTATGSAIEGQIVDSSTLELSGNPGLTEKQIKSEIKKHQSKIQQCYEQALLDDSNLSGRVEYDWEISGAGRVSNAKVKSTEINNGKTLNSCVIGVIRKIKFPKAKNGRKTFTSIGFPFGKL